MTPNLETMAEAVHEAYLTTCARLGWEVKPSNQVPYSALSEDSKELDRASVHAVLAFISPPVEPEAPAPAPLVVDWDEVDSALGDAGEGKYAKRARQAFDRLRSHYTGASPMGLDPKLKKRIATCPVCLGHEFRCNGCNADLSEHVSALADQGEGSPPDTAPAGLDMKARDFLYELAACLRGWQEVDEFAQSRTSELLRKVGDYLTATAPAALTTLRAKSATPDPVRVALTWTKEKPKVEGWYFLRMPDIGEGNPGPMIVDFIMDDREAGVMKWYQDDETGSEWEPIYDGREWAGPIQIPKEPKP